MNAAAALDDAIAHEQAGRRDLAEQVYRELLHREPARDEVWRRLGILLFQTGRQREAADCLTRAVELQPAAAQHRNTLAVILQDGDELERAAEQLEEAVRLKPDYAEAHNNLGNVWQKRGQPERAVECYREAIRLRPNYSLAYCNLGAVYRLLEREADALAPLAEALRLQPARPDAEYNLGACLTQLGRQDEAAEHLLRAIALAPRHSAAYTSLGLVRQRQGLLGDAIDCYRRAMEFDPYNVDVHGNLLFCLAHDPSVSAAESFAEHCRWAELHAPARPARDFPNLRDGRRPLRVGYVSGDFCHHALLRFIEPVLACHDPASALVFCYAMVRKPDAGTERLKTLVPHWRSIVDQTDDEVVAQIRRDQIDILVDLSGHTGRNRLTIFAHRPAPVQATWLGYPHTTGMTAIDYRLTDAIMDPPGEPAISTERPIHLPRGVCCVRPMHESPPVTPLHALRAGRITFGSMHRLTKLNAAVLDAWSRVLQAAPGSRLLVLRDTLAGRAREELLRQFDLRGVSRKQLDLRDKFDARGHLAVFEEIDITLDTFPYNGGTISCESLWMGVPLVTLRGDRPPARAGASLLTSVGLGDLVARTVDEYVQLVVQLAADLPRLAAIRESLRPRMMATLCDGVAFTRDLEAAYREMWKTWCESAQSSAN